MLSLKHGCWFALPIACIVGCQTPAGVRGLSVTKSEGASPPAADAPPMRLASGTTPELKSRWSPPPTKEETTPSSVNATPPPGQAPEQKPVNAVSDLRGAIEDTSMIESFADLPPKERELAQRQFSAVVNQRTRKDIAAAHSAPKLTTPPPSSEGSSAEVTEDISAPDVDITDDQDSTTERSAIQRVAHSNTNDKPAAKAVSAAYFQPDSRDDDADSRSQKGPASKPSKPAPPEQLTETQLFDALLKKLESEEGLTTEEVLRRTVVRRTLLVLNNQLDAAVEPIAGLEASEQQFLHHQFTALSTLIDEKGPPARSRRYTAALPFLREALSHLGAATGKLDVHVPIFCTEVESFGNVTRFEKEQFNPGQQVILYCEVDQFVAQQTATGYETHLQGSYEIFDKEGVKVAEQTLPEDKQSCAHYRRDYFIAYRMYLPSHLEPGNYMLRLTMEDHKGKLFGQSEAPFQILAP